MSVKQRVSFLIPPELHTAYVRKAEELGLTQSALFTIALWQYIRQEAGIKALAKMTNTDCDEKNPGLTPEQLVQLVAVLKETLEDE